MNRFLLLALATILIFAPSTLAQQSSTATGAPDNAVKSQHPAQTYVPEADEQLKFLAGKLDLTADQQTRAKPILDALHDATLKIVQDQSLSQDERLAQVRPFRYKARDQLLEILTDDQKKKLDVYLQGPHPEMHGNLTGTQASPQPQRN